MFKRTSIVIAAGLVVATHASACMEPVSRMYDFRDLAAVLPPMAKQSAAAGSNPFFSAVTLGERRVPVLSDIPILGQAFSLNDPVGVSNTLNPAGASLGASMGDVDDQSPTDILVAKLCNLTNLSKEELIDHVYFIDGEESDHKRFIEAIESVRGLYQERVQVEVSCYEVDAGASPAIGDAAQPNQQAAVTAKSVAIRKTPTRVQSTRAVTYISRWTPIVGESSVGLEPGTSTAADGVVLDVCVGAGREKPLVSVQGAISKVEISTLQLPSDQTMVAGNTSLSPGGALMTIGLPQTERRAIETNVAVPFNRPTVVASVPGFNEGKQILVVVTLKQAD